VGDGAERAEVGDPSGEPVESIAVGDVEDERLDERTGARRRQAIGRRLERRVVQIDEQQRIHHGAEPLRAREPHPAAGTGDDAHGRHAVAAFSSRAATASGSVIIRSWPVSMSQSRRGGPGRLHADRVAGRQCRRADDVALGDRPQRRLVGEPERLLEALPGMGRQSLAHPGDVVGVGHPVVGQRLGSREQHELDAVDHPTLCPCRPHQRPRDVDERLAGHRGSGVQVHEMADPAWSPVGHAGDHHAPRT
jgi:hypothetical protein